jgi:Protein of Unknown function (DUF2784)
VQDQLITRALSVRYPCAPNAITQCTRAESCSWAYFGDGSVVLAGDKLWYRAGADVVVVMHLLFIAFVAGGAFLAWRWPLIIWGHVPAVMYGALIEFAGFTCPLTLLENDLRRRAGAAGYSGGFIDHYLIRVIYPPGLTHGMQIGLGVLVLLVAMLGYWGFRRRHGWGLKLKLSDQPAAEVGCSDCGDDNASLGRHRLIHRH